MHSLPISPIKPIWPAKPAPKPSLKLASNSRIWPLLISISDLFHWFPAIWTSHTGMGSGSSLPMHPKCACIFRMLATASWERSLLSAYICQPWRWHCLRSYTVHPLANGKCCLSTCKNWVPMTSWCLIAAIQHGGLLPFSPSVAFISVCASIKPVLSRWRTFCGLVRPKRLSQ